MISRRLLTTFAHVLCYFAHSYTHFSRAQCAIFSCTSSFLDSPVPLHLPFSPLFLVQPDQVFLGSRLHSRTHRDHTLYNAITHLNVRYIISHLRCLHATTIDDSPQSFQTPTAVPQPFQHQRQPPLPSKTTVTPTLSHNGDHPHHLPASTPAPPSTVLIPQPPRWRQLT